MKLHRARILAMQAIFQIEFRDCKLEGDLTEYRWIDYKIPHDEQDFARKMIVGVVQNLKQIDSLIQEYSEHWDFRRISPVNKAILRIAIYHLTHAKETIPAKVVINEAIRLGKEFAEKDSSRFINGLLDSFYKIQVAPSC